MANGGSAAVTLATGAGTVEPREQQFDFRSSHTLRQTAKQMEHAKDMTELQLRYADTQHARECEMAKHARECELTKDARDRDRAEREQQRTHQKVLGISACAAVTIICVAAIIKGDAELAKNVFSIATYLVSGGALALGTRGGQRKGEPQDGVSRSTPPTPPAPKRDR